MRIHKNGRGDSMLSVPFTDLDARERLVREEDDRRRESRLPRNEVRASLARDIGIKPGTIENIRRNRFGSLQTAVRDKIYGWMLMSLQRDVQRLEHEIFLALQCGASPTSDDLLGAQAALAKAKEALKKGMGGAS